MRFFQLAPITYARLQAYSTICLRKISRWQGMQLYTFGRCGSASSPTPTIHSHRLLFVVPLCLCLINISTALKYPGGLPPTAIGYNTFRNGPWPFVGCTDAQGEYLVGLWKDTGRLIDQMIADVGPNSRYGFSAFFSTNRPTDVANVLDDIRKRRGFSTVNYNKKQDDLYVVCVNEPRSGASGDVAPGDRYSREKLNRFRRYCDYQHGSCEIFSTPGEDIYLCPKFFDTKRPKNLATKSDCPKLQINTVTGDTRFIEWFRIGENNAFLVLYQLSRKYAPETHYEKLYAINECYMARPDIQLNNGHNYGYYGSCKFSSILCKVSPMSLSQGTVEGGSILKQGTKNRHCEKTSG